MGKVKLDILQTTHNTVTASLNGTTYTYLIEGEFIPFIRNSSLVAPLRTLSKLKKKSKAYIRREDIEQRASDLDMVDTITRLISANMVKEAKEILDLLY